MVDLAKTESTPPKSLWHLNWQKPAFRFCLDARSYRLLAVWRALPVSPYWIAQALNEPFPVTPSANAWDWLPPLNS